MQLSTAYTTSQLVHTRQAKTVCAGYQHESGVWDIDSDLDHCCGDENVDIPVFEGFDGLLGGFLLILAGKRRNAHTVLGKVMVVECGDFLHRCDSLQDLVLSNHGAYNVALMSSPHFLQNESQNLSLILCDPRNHRLTPGRHRANHFQLDRIAINDLSQTSWDRGGTHRDLMNSLFCLGDDLGPLGHAKLVFFVHNGNRKIFVIYGIRHTRVRTDDELCFSTCDLLKLPALFFLFHPAIQEGELNTVRLKKRLHAVVVLFCKDFCGGHDHSLIAGTNQSRCNQGADNGLAAANITLHQSVDPLPFLRSCRQVSYYGLLVFRKRKRKVSIDGVHQLQRSDCVFAFYEAICMIQCVMNGKIDEVIDNAALFSNDGLAHILWFMDEMQRTAHGKQIIFLDHIRRQHLTVVFNHCD